MVPMTRVKMSLYDHDWQDPDDACHLVGAFARKAREQGWNEEDIERVCLRLPVESVLTSLSPHIEATDPEPLSWRHQLERLTDYAEGAAILKQNPWGLVRWWLKGFESPCGAVEERDPWPKPIVFGHALKRGRIARNLRDLRASHRRCSLPSPSSVLSLHLRPCRGVTPSTTFSASSRHA